MKKNIMRIFVAVVSLAIVLPSCKKKEEGLKLTDETQVAVIEQFVNHTIAPTYTNLANNTDLLVEELKALRADMTQTNLEKVCNTFLTARAWWEMSEAFLFGAASDFGIDPHIDSWPLDVDAFNTMMLNENQIHAMDGEDGDVYAGEKLGNSLLGFHGIEYILFANGSPKNIAQISDLDMIYAIAVAGDLRNRCFQLEVSWIGNAAAKAHRDKVEELELNTTVNGGNFSYGQNLKKAGTIGSTYTSSVNGLMAIIDGCKTIADEVGTSKIGKPYNGEDPDYIESPYSHKSIEDFYNNIISIENAYYGGIEGQRNETYSLHNYIKTLNADVDAKVVAAINNAKSKIKAMPVPFVQNYQDPANGVAAKACQNLDDVLSAVNRALSEN